MREQDRLHKRMLYEERWRLYQKLDRLGYIPDEDIRTEIEQIKTVLNARIKLLSNELLVSK